VVKVESSFNEGQFLQTLTCVRLNNQSGEGAPIDLVDSAKKGIKDIDKQLKDAKENLKRKKLIDNNKELVEDLSSGKFEIEGS
jgi:hypothetical protein